MVFSSNSALETSTPPTSPLGVPISPSFRSPGSIMGSPLMPHRRPRTSSYPTSPLRSPPDLGPDYMAIDEEEFEEPVREEPRLVIRRLVLINYKSYAGRQEVGPFNENFTAVVGPNGSGKSNVIDSMLFAFGFRAKKMRQDKLTGLIHNSESHPNLQFARVEVHFETTGVPDSELRLAREIRRDGTNFYTLNEKRASFSEVAALLEERGIDLRHKRFLILQGEVESISLMPPKAENGSDDGLLEYLEDIIGTTYYKTRIAELDGEQERLKADASEKQTRAEIVYKDTRKLDNERAQIERYMINQNKGIMARSSLYQLYIFRLKNAIRLTEGELEERRAAIVVIQNKMTENRRRLEEINAQTQENNPQITQWREELRTLTAKLKDAKLREVKLKQQHEQRVKRLKKAERELAHATTEKQQSELWLKNFEEDSVKLQNNISEITNTKANELRVLEQMRSELQDSTRELQEEAQRLQNQAEPWRAQISQKNQAIEGIKTHVSDMRKQVKDLEAKDREVVAQAEDVIQTGKASRREVKTLSEHLEKITKEQSEAAKKIPELTVSRDEALKILQVLRPEVSAARESRASSQSRNRIESELMRLKIPGLYGRLGSLGSIDQKYDVAISTAGPELNNFVVDNVETAKRCLDELRKRSIGRARFMVLEKLREPNRADPSSFPAPRLLDLVKPVDPLFIKAFSSALGDTLVVDTPENASRTAFNGPKRYNVVTLGGILVNSSGKMSGGGAPSRGLMAKSVATVSPEELEALEKKMANYELEYAESRQRLAHFQARDEELTAEIPRVKMSLDREETLLKQQESRMNEIKEKRRALKAEIAESTQRCNETAAQATSQIAALEKDRADMEFTSKPIEEKIQAVQEKILNAGGLRLRQQREKVTELEERENDIRRQLSDGQQNMANELSKLKKNITLIEKYTAEISASSEAQQETDQNLVQEIASMEREMQGLSVLLDKSANEAEIAKSEAAELRTEIDELRASEIESANSLQKMVQTQSDKSRKLKEYESKWASLKLNDVKIAQSLDIVENNTDEKDEIEGNGFDDEVIADDDMNAGAESIKAEQDGESNPNSHSSVTELSELSPDEIQDLNEDDLKREISNSERACESQSFDMSVLDRYRQRYLEYRERKSVSDQALASYEAVKDELQSLTRRRFNEFMEGFREISSKLKELYQLITMGGNAELELVDTMDPFAEGILFSVMPPKKSWRNISNLSGGEKTLSSLALVFALHHYKPTPIYVMDEIDAALDFRNVSIIANYIKERTKNGQFIVISLRNNMFELASRLVGVYKVNNMTRSVALQTN